MPAGAGTENGRSEHSVGLCSSIVLPRIYGLCLQGAEVTKKVLRPTKADSALPVTFIQAGTPTDEAEAIADQIQRLLKGEEEAAGGGAAGAAGAGGSSVQPGDIAVLFRCFKMAGCKTHMQLQASRAIHSGVLCC